MFCSYYCFNYCICNVNKHCYLLEPKAILLQCCFYIIHVCDLDPTVNYVINVLAENIEAKLLCCIQ